MMDFIFQSSNNIDLISSGVFKCPKRASKPLILSHLSELTFTINVYICADKAQTRLGNLKKIRMRSGVSGAGVGVPQEGGRVQGWESVC